MVYKEMKDICFEYDTSHRKKSRNKIYLSKSHHPYVKKNGYYEINKHFFIKMTGKSIKENEIVIPICGNKRCMNHHHLRLVKKIEATEYLAKNKIKPKFSVSLDWEFIFIVDRCLKESESKDIFKTYLEKKSYDEMLSLYLKEKASEAILEEKPISKTSFKRLEKDIRAFTEKIIESKAIAIYDSTRRKPMEKFESYIPKIFCIEADWINGSRAPSRSFYQKLINKKIPKDENGVTLVVMHICNNPKCIRRDHLVLGTYKDNSEDKIFNPERLNRKGIYKDLIDPEIRKKMYIWRVNYNMSYIDIGKHIGKYLKADEPFFHTQVKGPIRDYAKKNNLPLPARKTNAESAKEKIEDILFMYFDKEITFEEISKILDIERHVVSNIGKEEGKKRNLSPPKTSKELAKENVEKILFMRFNERKEYTEISKELGIDRHDVSDLCKKEGKKRNLYPLKTIKDLIKDNIEMIVNMREFQGKKIAEIIEFLNKKYPDIKFKQPTISRAYKEYKEQSKKIL